MSGRQDILMRGIRIVTALAPHVLDGMAVSEIAQKTHYSMSVICRDLASLKEAGWARKEQDRWFLTAAPLALAQAVNLAFQTASDRQSSLKHNINAQALRMLED